MGCIGVDTGWGMGGKSKGRECVGALTQRKQNLSPLRDPSSQFQIRHGRNSRFGRFSILCVGSEEPALCGLIGENSASWSTFPETLLLRLVFSLIFERLGP